MIYEDVMVDIETTSLDPHHGAILQIAAVKFNLKELTINADDVFYKSLAIPHNRFWSADTLAWWQKDKLDILTDIYSRQQPPETVMEELEKFSFPIQSLRFWSKPSHFDFTYIDSYFKQFNIPSMFSYRRARDMNSFIAGLYQGEEVPPFEKELAMQGKAHNALDDALFQIKVLFAHVENVRSKSNVNP